MGHTPWTAQPQPRNDRSELLWKIGGGAVLIGLAVAVLLLVGGGGESPYLESLRSDAAWPEAEEFRKWPDQRLVELGDSVCGRFEGDPPADLLEYQARESFAQDWLAYDLPTDGHVSKLYWKALEHHCQPETFELARRYQKEYGDLLQEQTDRILGR